MILLRSSKRLVFVSLVATFTVICGGLGWATGSGCGTGLRAAEEEWWVRQPPVRPHPSGLPQADPASFPNEAAFRLRAEQIIRAVAQEDLAKWRRGYFAKGDPGKYLHQAAWAKLLLNPADPQALEKLNDDRNPTEHYHFAALNQARTVPLFGDFLTEKTLAATASGAARFSSYMGLPGTENHKVMNRLPALVLPDFLPGDGTIGKRDKAAAYRETIRWLQMWVRGMYAAGMGEWESTTYHMFCLNSMLNIYDFSQDEAARVWAAAGLEYLAAVVAQKYRDGITCGPSQRGMSQGQLQKTTDRQQWLWYGSEWTPTKTDFRFAMHAVLSSWRPNEVLTALATKDLAAGVLPYSAQNSKPNYWVGLKLEPKKNVLQETLWVDQTFTLGSLWSGWDPYGQTTRWQLACEGNPGVTFTGGQHYAGRTRDGLGRFDQTLQYQNALVVLSKVPTTAEWEARGQAAFAQALQDGEMIRSLVKDEQHGEHPEEVWEKRTLVEADRAQWVDDFVQREEKKAPARSFFSLPRAAPTPIYADGVWLFDCGSAMVAIAGVNGSGRIAGLEPNERARKGAAKHGHTALPETALVFTPANDQLVTGFVVQAMSKGEVKSLAAWRQQLQLPTYDPTSVSVSVQHIDGTDLKLTWSAAERQGIAMINDVAVDYTERAVASSPTLFIDGTTLRVSNGTVGYAVDVSGEVPVWSDWSGPANATR